MNAALDRERRDLGRALQDLRKAAGVTGQQLAARTGISQPKISKIENALITLTVADTERIADALGVDESQRASLRQTAARLENPYRGWTKRHPNWLLEAQAEASHEEEHTTMFRDYQATVIQGLLQTKAYAREVITRFAGVESTPVDAAVSARMLRQRVLADFDKKFCFLVEEGVLRKPICPPRDMVAQMDQIERCSAADNVRIGIVPAFIDTEVIPTTSFEILDRDSVSIETAGGSLDITSDEEVRYYERVFETLQKHAVFEEDFTKLLRRIRRTYARDKS